MKQQIEAGGEQLILLPERALWWPAASALIVADIHWAKSGHFRRHGLAMPAAVQTADGQRLAQIVRQYKAARLIIAGDFFHSHLNKEVDDFTHWRRQHPALRIDFIPGNHDILPQDLYEQWQLHIHPAGLDIAPFHIAHDEVQKPGFITIHGHLHPGIRLGQGRPLPCFCLTKNSLVLPAFSSFTGCKIVSPNDYEQLFVIGEGKVLKVK